MSIISPVSTFLKKKASIFRTNISKTRKELSRYRSIYIWNLDPLIDGKSKGARERERDGQNSVGMLVESDDGVSLGG
tara:strand:- start:61 stop:291 length:231 start_codon:yes stop_codon:yes gene_type:complete